MKALRRDANAERKEQSASPFPKTTGDVKDKAENRRPESFHLYGVGEHRTEHRSDPFHLYGVKKDEGA